MPKRGIKKITVIQAGSSLLRILILIRTKKGERASVKSNLQVWTHLTLQSLS